MTRFASSRGQAIEGGQTTMNIKLKKAPSPTQDGTIEEEETNEIQFSIAVEKLRLYAYIAFWGMCFFAITITKTLVRPLLLKGAEDGSVCGPFNRDSPEFGVLPGQGFDIDTHSHLQELFGFANICVNWDYSPSRELTAMVYPTFEYSLLVYLVFDFIATILANKRGELSPWFWTFSRIVFPINIFLCAQFRMIFVCIAYENVSQHTAGFMGLQISLILVALQNSGFVWETNTAYSFLGGGDDFELKLKRTRQAIIVYLAIMLSVSTIKIIGTVHVVLYGIFPDWLIAPSIFPDMVVAQVVDVVWMIFNAVIPLILAYFRSREDEPLQFTVVQEQVYAFEDDGDDDDGAIANESTPLSGESI